ncbi:MAG: asparagine synthase C-terminal domain-containing protein, partial [Cytophagales bacterium]|nr:asparagine synthase C-terminal domain-containing protein [Cytophagales bacterium]
ILSNTQNSRYQRVAELVNFKNRKHLYSHVFSQEQYYFSEAEIGKLVRIQGKTDFGWVNPSYSLSRKLKPREKQALTDIDTYLKDDLMVKMDRASMRFGLEVRNPLLDYRMIAYSLNLDVNLKVRNGKTKYLLKQVLFDMVPEKYFLRPKWGFSIPLNQWLKKELYYLVESYLSHDRISDAGLVYPAAVSELLHQWKSGKDYLYNRVWQLIILHRWYFKAHGKIGNR